MDRSKSLVIVILLLVLALSFAGAEQGWAQGGEQTRPAAQLSASGLTLPPCTTMRCITPAMRAEAAARAAAARQSGLMPQLGAPVPGGTPDYFGIYPNFANSPIIRKFVDTLPGLGYANRNNLQQYIPIAVPDTQTYQGADYYEIGLTDYTQQMHSDLPATTKFRGYYQINTSDPTVNVPKYMGPVIIASRDKPVRIKFSNQLGLGTLGNLFLPVDTSVMGAGTGPLSTTELYTQNRASVHLHGGATPWISDGTPHQWITPSGESTSYPKGVSQQNVPDMPNPGPGSATFYYTNQQSSRFMFYHDHAYGITRLNVYAGEAAGYLLTDTVEEGLINNGTLPNLGGVYRYGIPLIIQDKTFVPDALTLAAQDPTWNWGGTGNLWFPHVYMPNQNPNDAAGVNAMGRWDYGPWFWPPVTSLAHGAIVGDGTNGCPLGLTCPGTPNPTIVPEAFMDTPIVNGTAYPVLTVQPGVYRFRILNACNDRTLNLQLYYAADATGTLCTPSTAATSCTEIKMLPAVPAAATSIPPLCPEGVTTGVPTTITAGAPYAGPGCWPETWPTDGRDGGVPDPTTVGPNMIQIGSEGGFLPAPVVLDNTPVGYEYFRRSITVLNVSNKTLFIGPAERADIIIDFSGVPVGSKLILYNDSPAPVPAFDPRFDYYTGDVDQSYPTGNGTGGAPTTQPGHGPNTRTIMQIVVDPAGTPASNPALLANLQAALPAAYVASQPGPIVPETAYGGTTDNYARIEDTSMTFTRNGGATVVTLPMQPKAIQELFELNYGRMNATLGVERPFTNFTTQTTIPYGYIDPPTEIISDGQEQIWKITHNGVDTHFIHFHLFNVQVVNRVGWDGSLRPPDPNELGWKETVRMNPLEDAIVALRPTAPSLPFQVPDSVRPLDPTSPLHTTTQFTGVDPNGNPITVSNELTNFGWEYVWHCHILGHEENDMMRPIVMLTTFSISGQVTTASSTGPVALPGVTVKLTGASTRTATTDLSGNYTFTGLSYGNYTVTPGLTGYSFTPTNRAVTISGASVTGQDFTSVFSGAGYSISGTATTTGPSGLVPLPGVTVILSGSSTGTATTDGAGNYTFTGLGNGSYTVTPFMSGYGFTPASRAVTVSGASIIAQDFTAFAGHSISGTITRTTLTGPVPMPDVMVVLSGGAGIMTMTDRFGNYVFTGLPDSSYTVTPTLAGYTCTPANRAVTLSGANVTGQDFSAALYVGAPVSTIAGTVTTAGLTGPVPLPGVMMSLGGTVGTTRTTTTDAAGKYSFTGLANGDYTVTPSLAGYDFTPANRAVTISGASVPGQDFTGVPGSATYSVSGTVTTADVSGPVPLPGVMMTLSGSVAAMMLTDSLGHYTFTGLGSGSYTVTPALVGYNFTPVNRAVTITVANVTGQDFAATVGGGLVYTISGTVTISTLTGPVPLSGVTMGLSGDAVGTTATDGAGNYTFTGLVNGAYTVTPSMTGATFTPVNIPVTISGASVAGVNFTRN